MRLPASPFLLSLLLAVLLTAAGAGGTVSAAEAAREAGHPFLRNFTPREYHSQGQVWAAAQDRQGLLYFGTKACVLEYDGVSWRQIGVGTPIDVVHSLAVDPATDTVYVGGTNELGYLRAGPDGKEFVSLLAQLPADARDNLHEIYGAYSTPEGIVFVAVRQVMRWHDGRFQVWKLPGKFRVLSGFAHGKVYLQTPERGLLRLDGDALVPAATDPIFSKSFLMSVAPAPEGGIVAGTFRDGAYTVRDGVTTPLPEPANALLKKHEIRSLLRLPDGSLAVGTSYAGVVVLDPKDTFRDHWDESCGLQNNTLLNLFGDREGGVWLCLDVGITRVEPNPALTLFDTSSGLKRESVQRIARVNGTLTVATSTGLYRLLPTEPEQARTARWERLPGVDGNFNSLCGFDGTLLASGMQGLLQIDSAGKATTLYTSADTCEAVWRSEVHPERVFLGTYAGMRSLRCDPRTRQWTDEGPIPGVTGEIRTLAEDGRGNLWAASYNTGVFRVRLGPDAAGGVRGPAAVTAYLGREGSSLRDAPWAEVRRFGDRVLLCTKTGLYRLDPAKAEFVPATEYGARFTDGTFRLEYASPDAAGRAWVIGRSAAGLWLEPEMGCAVPGENGAPGAFRPLPNKVSLVLDDVGHLLPEEDGTVWITGANGIARMDAGWWLDAPPPPPLQTLVRGSAAFDEGDGQSRPRPVAGDPLPYRQNSVRFDYAANTYAIGAGLRYQTRLLGAKGGQWSGPMERTSVDYGNLWEGRYGFEVRALNGDGRLGEVASLPFRVLPPWPRSPWAYGLYAPLAAAALYGLARWQMRRLRARNFRLEDLVARRTEELRTQQDELVRARDAAETANRAKSAFLANMSHELRTPLNAILGYTQILLKDDELSPRNRERLAVVSGSGGHLLTMINEVLDLSKIEAGKLTLEPADFRLGSVLDDVAAAFRLRLLEKGLRFEFRRGPDLPEVVHADAGKLRQVIFNLLSNAVKFTRRGAVTLEVTRLDRDRTRFAVADTGVGIPEAEVRDIFLAFHQVGERRLAAQGTGLGLTISQRLVELMGGALEVASHPGEGSRFWFDLPLPEIAAPAVPSPAELPPHAPVVGYEGPRRRLLIVDDEPLNRHILRGLLEPLGFELEEAADGDECLERCAAHPPDALLLDLRMDRVDGFEVARRLRAARNSGGGSGPRIIAVSASVFDDQRQQAIDAGCDEFLPKPFREEQLLAALGRVVGVRWIVAPTDGSTAAPAPPAGTEDGLPPAGEIDALLELSRRGDILGLKKRLGALQAADSPGGQRLARDLEPLVAAYQMDRIRDVLHRFKDHGKH